MEIFLFIFWSWCILIGWEAQFPFLPHSFVRHFHVQFRLPLAHRLYQRIAMFFFYMYSNKSSNNYFIWKPMNHTSWRTINKFKRTKRYARSFAFWLRSTLDSKIYPCESSFNSTKQRESLHYARFTVQKNKTQTIARPFFQTVPSFFKRFRFFFLVIIKCFLNASLTKFNVVHDALEIILHCFRDISFNRRNGKFARHRICCHHNTFYWRWVLNELLFKWMNKWFA